ncbi:IclR family transcriptional regulator [Micromonospora sp. NPDC000316]|uniref:IclR family transcriptional regulator n=1 Tax=Micromonospora sp. NPDC000316 TaxID=3364216 RepID=UPI0036ADED38
MSGERHGHRARRTGNPGSAAGGPTRTATIQSIDRAASVLALLDQDTCSLTPALVADRLGLNRTTAHRYLQSLQRAGFLSASYGPGPLLDQLSALVSVRQQILTLAPAVMRQLSDTTGLTTVLSFLGRSGAVVTLVEEANQGTIVLTVRVGTVLGLRAAQTRVLLAFQSDPAAVARAHERLTPAEAAAEQHALVGVRRHRVAWADLDREGFVSVAVPIFATRNVQAAMALLGTTAMLRPAGQSTERVHALEQAAQTLGSLVAS